MYIFIQKRCIAWKLPFRSSYGRDCGNSLCVNVAVEKCKILIFWINFLLLGKLLLKAHFNLVPPANLQNHGVTSYPLRKVIRSFHKNFSSTINMQRKSSIKSLPWRGLMLPFYESMKLGVLAKLTLKCP